MKRDIKDKKTGLQLSRETIRVVTDSQLTDVVGGSFSRFPSICLACKN